MLRVNLAKVFLSYLYAQIKGLSFLGGRAGSGQIGPQGFSWPYLHVSVSRLSVHTQDFASKHSIVFPLTAFLYLSWLPQFMAALPTVVCNIWVKYTLNQKQPLGCSAPPLQGCPLEPKEAMWSSVDLRGSALPQVWFSIFCPLPLPRVAGVGGGGPFLDRVRK